jgi:pimeloyl-ACP methyl ester carboxylesterase
MYHKMVDMLSALGFPVLRFDFYGLGDSEGTLDDKVLPDLYGAIQLGRYVADTRRAIEWMRTTCHVDRVILGGLCGGAITGVLAAAGDRHVAGLFGLGLPVMLDGSNIDRVDNMTSGQLGRIRQRYLSKLLSPSSWVRALTLKTDFRLLLKSMLLPLRKQRATVPKPAGSSADPAPRGNANPYFREAFGGVLSQDCPVLLLFSESDRLYAEFREKFLEPHGSMLKPHAHLVDIRVVSDANHVFTFSEWQRDMTHLLEVWFNDRFPGDAARAEAGTNPQHNRDVHQPAVGVAQMR